MKPDFDTMNETDVREIIVRPLLSRLGYAHGTQANIRTEVPLRYDKAFLGRKNPSKDPPLAGRADYICEAISFGRWAVEVKAPYHVLNQDDVEQAHTYCAHPGVSAIYFILTNGREFRLYATAQLEKPVFDWKYENIEQHMMTLFNILGYEAIRKLTKIVRPDTDKPLAAGIPSKMKILGGEVRYGEHRSNHPLFKTDALNKMIGSVTGGGVERAADSRLCAIVRVRSPYQQLAELNKLAGLEDFHFFCADEFVSTDPEKPTIFQNVVAGRLEPGARATLIPGMPAIAMPGFQYSVYTDAIGYLVGETFVGVLSFEYDYQLMRDPSGNPRLDAVLATTPPTAKLEGQGEFTILLQSTDRGLQPHSI
jgi:hypothetical protein